MRRWGGGGWSAGAHSIRDGTSSTARAADASSRGGVGARAYVGRGDGVGGMAADDARHGAGGDDPRSGWAPKASRKESSPILTLGFVPLSAGPEPNLQRMRGVGGLHQTPAGPRRWRKG